MMSSHGLTARATSAFAPRPARSRASFTAASFTASDSALTAIPKSSLAIRSAACSNRCFAARFNVRGRSAMIGADCAAAYRPTAALLSVPLVCNATTQRVTTIPFDACTIRFLDTHGPILLHPVWERKCADMAGGHGSGGPTKEEALAALQNGDINPFADFLQLRLQVPCPGVHITRTMPLTWVGLFRSTGNLYHQQRHKHQPLLVYQRRYQRYSAPTFQGHR